MPPELAARTDKEMAEENDNLEKNRENAPGKCPSGQVVKGDSTGQPKHAAEIQKLRTLFTETYKDKDAYDPRDVQRFHQNDAYTLRFLLHQQLDLKKATIQADSSLKFRKQYCVNDLRESSFDRIFHDNGAIYYRKFDREGHQILWFRVCKNKKDPDVIFKVKQYIAWWIDKSFSKQPDKRIVVCFDMTDVGLANVDVELIKYQVSCFSTYFPGMLAYMLVYEMPWVLNAIWKLIKNLLTAEQQKRVLFVKKNTIQQYISPENLPVHMGGRDDYVYTYLPSDEILDRFEDSTPDDGPVLNGQSAVEDHFSSVTSIPTATQSSTAKQPSQATSVPGVLPHSMSESALNLRQKQLTVTTANRSDPVLQRASSLSPPRKHADPGSTTLKSGGDSPGTTVRKRVTFCEDNAAGESEAEKPSEQVGKPPLVSTSSSQKSVFQNSVVTVSPAEFLVFEVWDLNMESLQMIDVTNVSTSLLAFKVKTTNPESFRVRPSTGLVAAGESVAINVYLNPSFFDTVVKEKFLLMFMQVEDGAKLSALKDRWKNPPRETPDQYIEHRLFCQLRLPDQLQENDAMMRCENKLDEIAKQHEKLAGTMPDVINAYPEFSKLNKRRLNFVVTELVSHQKKLENRLSRVLCCQYVLGLFLVLFALLLFGVFVLDFPSPSWFSGCVTGGGVHQACAPFHGWGS